MARELTAYEHAVREAQQWAQEARTQRAIVLSILRHFHLPQQDYNALTLIAEKDAQMREAMLKSRDALHAAGYSLKWYRDRCPDAVNSSDSEADEQIGEALAALEAELRRVAATRVQGAGIGISVKAFIEAWNADSTDGVTPSQDVRAWEHEDDPTRVISATQKAQAERDGGASASSVRPYSVPLVRGASGVQGREGHQHGAWKPVVWSDPTCREAQMVVLERDASGKPTVWCDPEIVDIVRALNAGGLRTIASCSGHGEKVGWIALQDGRQIAIAPDLESFKGLIGDDVIGMDGGQPK